MKYNRIENEHYNVHLINSDKFKKISMSFVFRDRLKKENITINNVLSAILPYSNSLFKSNRELNLECERLYNLSLGSTHSITREILELTVSVSILDPKYTSGNLFNDGLMMLYNTIYKPNIIGHKFDSKSFGVAHRAIRKSINDQIEKPGSFASHELMKAMDEGKSFLSYESTGDIEDLDNINEASLYEYYQHIINNGVLDIIIAGNIKEIDIESTLKELLKDIKNPKEELYTNFIHAAIRDKYQVVKFKRKNSQSILKIGFKMDETSIFEDAVVLPIYSIILGGGFESKLFQTVREKNSLCYRIYDRINRQIRVMAITAGISAHNYEKALELSLNEVNEMLIGNITDKELKTAIKIFKTDLEMDEESLGSIVGSYMHNYFYGLPLPTERLEMLKKVTKEDLVNYAKKMHIDTVLLVEGDDVDAKV